MASEIYHSAKFRRSTPTHARDIPYEISCGHTKNKKTVTDISTTCLSACVDNKYAVFRRGVGHFERRFQRKGASPTNHYWYQSSRVIALSCGIKIYVVRHLVLSQWTRVTDGQTDGRTELRLPRPPSHMLVW